MRLLGAISAAVAALLIAGAVYWLRREVPGFRAAVAMKRL